MIPAKNQLIVNDRVLAFPFGQHAPALVLEAAFELGKKSALLAVDENPFVSPRPRLVLHDSPDRLWQTDRFRGAAAVAWLRGHCLASKVNVAAETLELLEAA